MAAVNAFKQAFSQTYKSVGLVLKTMNTNPVNPEWQDFLKECKADKRIYVLTETMDRPDVLGLIDCCDAYVSLHRAEGFGRTMAEAILLGKPVIASDYSGNVDFQDSINYLSVEVKLVKVTSLDYQWIDSEDEAVWGDVVLSSCINKMKKIKNKSDTYGCDINFIKFSPGFIAKYLDAYLLNGVF